MPQGKLKVIVLTHGGAERFLELLSDVEEVEIAGVFVETIIDKKRGSLEKLKRSIRYDGVIPTFRKFGLKRINVNGRGRHVENELGAVQSGLIERAAALKVPLIKVDNYHSAQAINAMREADADLGILYGTNIVKESVFAIPRMGSINIHQGLAPYYRGGPTVFWELLNGEKEVGITVHFVAAMVDTGDIIRQTTVPLDYDFSAYGTNYEQFLQDFRTSLVEPSARLLVDAVRQIAAGSETRIPQDTTLGKRYKLPTKSEKDELLRVLTKRQKARRS